MTDLSTSTRPPSAAPDSRPGWTTFAAVMFVAAAASNAIYGISAIAKDDIFRVDELLFGDLAWWGVAYLVFAAGQAFVAFLVLHESTFGAVVGVLMALLHGTLAFMTIGAYPAWSIIALV